MRGRTKEQWQAVLDEKYGEGKYLIQGELEDKVKGKNKLVCSEHGLFEVNLSVLLNRRQGCKGCVGVKPRKLKHSAEEALNEVKRLHSELEIEDFSSYYIGSRTMVKAKCKEHGEFERTWHHMTGAQRRGCPRCMREAARFAYTFEEYTTKCRAVHNSEYEYVPGSFSGVSGTIDLVCKSHGISTVTCFNHMNGSRCVKCSVEKRSEASKISFEEFVKKAKLVHGDRYYYSPEGYRGMTGRVAIDCPVHGRFTQKASDHVHCGAGCQVCAKHEAAKSRTTTFKEFVDRAKAIHGDRYVYLEKGYTGMADKAEIACREHGVFYQAASGHVGRGYGCAKCSHIVSYGELEVLDYIKSLGANVEGNFKYANRREFDILVTDQDLAIEYDGVCWHSSKYRPKARQLLKAQEAKELGVSLIRIFSDEWELKRKQVENLLAARLGKSNLERVYARTCEVVEITDQQARQFHDENHIQGWRRSGINLAIRKGECLLAVMTFTRSLSERGVKAEEGVYELARFSSSSRVVGGASKLLKRFISDYKATKIISYSDKRLFSGEMYGRLGFSEVAHVPPDYTYWKEGTKGRLHKSKFKRENLQELLGDAFDPSKSERENCEANGYYQVFDDGKIRWEWQA